MSQERFQRRHGELWDSLEAALDRDLPTLQRSEADALPAQYRRLCQHLALARHRRYSPALVDRLNRLAAKGHTHLYAHRVVSARELLARLVADFPRTVRREWRVVLAS